MTVIRLVIHIQKGVNICRIRIGAKLSMVEPISATLAGIALVQKSVDFIKSNIQTAQDIGQFVGAIDDAFKGEKECLKARDKKGADPFATENVAQEIIDAKLAREHLNEMKNLINLRFGPNTWQEILAERKRRIDAQKQAIKEKKAAKDKQMKEIGEILKYAGIGLMVMLFVGLCIYIWAMMNSAKAIDVWGKEEAQKVDPCVDYMQDVFVCMNEGPDKAAKHWVWVACPLIKQQPLNLNAVIKQTNGRDTEDEPFLKASKICQYDNDVVLLARECPKLISCDK